jgi:predicted ribosomally synthesized peptide with nif11-like leader
MSKEAVVRFWRVANGDEELREKIKDLTSDKDVVTFAKTHGFDFTEADIKAVSESVKSAEADSESELSEDQLEKVAGGGSFSLSSSSFGGLMSTSFPKGSKDPWWPGPT